MDMDLSIWVRAMINQWHLDLHRVGVSSPSQSRHHGSELCAGVRIGPLACGVQVLHRRSAKTGRQEAGQRQRMAAAGEGRPPLPRREDGTETGKSK